MIKKRLLTNKRTLNQVTIYKRYIKWHRFQIQWSTWGTEANTVKTGLVAAKRSLHLLFAQVSFCRVDHAGCRVEWTSFTWKQNISTIDKCAVSLNISQSFLEHQIHMHQCILFETSHKVSWTSVAHAWHVPLEHSMKFHLNTEHHYQGYDNISSWTLHEVSCEYETSSPHTWQQSTWNTSWSFAWTYSIITTCMTPFPLEHFMKFLQNMKHHCHMHDNSPFWRTSLPHVCEHEVLHKVS